MSRILDLIAESRYSLLTGTTAETATVLPGWQVQGFSFSAGGSDATLVITPGGAGQKAIALSTITVKAGKTYDEPLILGRLGAGTIFTFAGGVDSYVISIFSATGSA